MELLTQKQANFILKLDLTKKLEDIKNLTKKEASILIGKLLKNQKQDIAKDNSLDLQAFQVIENESEKVEIINAHYWDNAYKTWFYEQSKMGDYIRKEFKKHLVLKTKDGYCLDIELREPAIESRLWYDDETERPTNSKENFFYYNLQFLHDLPCNSLIKEPIDNTQYTTISNLDEYSPEVHAKGYKFVRRLTKEEQKDIEKINKFVKAKFEKRLETYWKKYSSKVHWSGYWVNR